jgi:hypothetical protein
MEDPVAGVLEELFGLRTNGNGYIQTEWDDVLLKRDLQRLMAEGRVQELPSPVMPGWPGGPERKRFQDLGTGETYEYSDSWERVGPRFKKLTLGNSGKTTP